MPAQSATAVHRRYTPQRARQQPRRHQTTALLVVESSSDRQVVLRMTEGDAFIVGRGRSADLAVADPYLSRMHVEIALTHQGVVVNDLGSRNGIYSKGIKVRRARLGENDRLVFGGSVLRVCLLQLEQPLAA